MPHLDPIATAQAIIKITISACQSDVAELAHIVMAQAVATHQISIFNGGTDLAHIVTEQTTVGRNMRKLVRCHTLGTHRPGTSRHEQQPSTFFNLANCSVLLGVAPK